LRDEAADVAEDMRNVCTICSLESEEFQSEGPYGFDRHRDEDHNVWNYLFYFIYLKQKDANEFTAAEEWVNDLKEASDTSFFPIRKAITLEYKSDSD